MRRNLGSLIRLRSVVSEVDIAWAAGLFEGEGCIQIWVPPSQSERWKHPQVRLSVAMTDRDVVEKFCRIVECGKVSPEQRRRPPRKNVYIWTIANRDDVERILLELLPHLGSRRTDKALAALAEIRQRRAELTHTCEGCGVEFEAKREFARFCSEPCRMRTYHAKYRGVRVADRVVA